MKLFLAFFLAFVGGCQALAPGDLSRVERISSQPGRCEVYLLRGWRDLYSSGIDELAGKLREAGLRATVLRVAQWRELAAQLSEAGKDGPREPIVLVGFSYGADDAIRIAADLERSRIAVDLIVTIDPVTPPTVPGNVRQCVNYYEPNGLWDVFPWFRGIPLTAVAGGPTVVNQNLRGNRKDLLEANTSHQTIAGNRKLHEEIVARVREVCAGAPPMDSSPLGW